MIGQPFMIMDSEEGLYQAQRPFSEQDVLALSYEILDRRFKRGHKFSGADDVKPFFKLKLSEKEDEVFACAFLTSQHELIAYEELFFGTVNGASVHPRVVVKRALQHNAAAVIFAHNHPSGITEPSQADVNITRTLKSVLDVIDVRVLDHFIVGEGDPLSFVESGYL